MGQTLFHEWYGDPVPHEQMGQTPPPPHPEWCAHLVPPELRHTPLHPDPYSTIVPLEMKQTSLYPEWYADPLPPEWCAHHVPREWCAHLVPSEMEQIPLFGERPVPVPEPEPKPPPPPIIGGERWLPPSPPQRLPPPPPLSLGLPVELKAGLVSREMRGLWGRLHHKDGRFKVPHRLRQVNQTAYEPELISIGPYHRNKEHLWNMEEIKNQFFYEFCSQKGEETMIRCFEAISKMEERARNWYETSVVDRINRTTFVEMMVVDGCFIIELLCKETKDQNPPMRWSKMALFGDLLLLENQLPFFVLVKLYGLIKDPIDGTEFAPKAFAKLIQVLLISRIGTENPSTIKDTDEIDHLLGLVHDNWLPSHQGIERHQKYMYERSRTPVERQSIRCARELEEAGIKFIKVDKNQESNAMSLFDVNFTNGKMKIPTFVIDNNTERLFRNLIAYELFVQGSTYVIDYVTLMDNLINTANDVKLLRHSEVIENMLGDDEAVAQMLNKLLDNVTLCGDTFFYEEIFDDVKKHCDKRWNTLQATLKHDYFSNPWARIAFVAGLLVFLTTIATFLLSFFKKN